MATLGKNQVFEIKNGDGTSFHNLVLRKSAVESIVMSLGDKISGDVYYKDNTLSVTMHEYITYNGVNYMLINPPTIVREGVVSGNGELRGMTKYSFVFYHPMCQLSNFPFTDVAVTSDETRYLSESKVFSWIGKPADFVAKMNKNLDGTEWIVEISSRFPQDKLNELSDVIPFDNATIADACKTFYDTWGVPYVVDKVASTEASYAVGKRFKLVMGFPSNEIYENAVAEQQQTPFVFQMGHGVGLKNNSRTPRNNKIITRISGYGSENNIPYGYPQVRWYGTAGQSFTYGDHAGVYTDVTIGGVHFDKVVSYPIYKGILNGEYVELIKHPFTRTHLMPSVYRTTLFNKISLYDDLGEVNTDYDPDITLVDYYDAIYSAQYPYPNTINLQAPSYESHEFEDEKPELGEAHIISATPLNNDLTPASSWDDSLDDEGNYKQSYFQMVLPQLSFDLYACASITEEMQINMRSGACLGCTFTVQVDWDDYKQNFYDEEGNFAPNGSQRDLTKYPKSNQGSISLVLQKDNSTFGTLMPNMYQYPKGETSSGAGDGDTFVILGISLPESYILAAEDRLDVDMKSYMLENNEHYFDYPLKFDEDFLFHNENILSQIRPNTVVRFNYAGQTQALFVKQITIKYGEQQLPQYDITLTDNVEVVLNQIGQVAEDVEKLSTLIAILRQSYGKNVWNELAKKLSKTQDDTAAGYITMLKGLQVGANFVPDILGEGGVLRMRDDGKVELVTDILYARVKAYFDTVEIREYKHTGGNRIASVAGNKICRVEYIKVVDNEETIVDDASEADFFRCYFRASDGEETVRNNWVVGDLAYCHVTSIVNSSDNPEQKGLNQKHLWRLVIGRNTDGTLTEDDEAYIDLSNRSTETISGTSYTGYQSGSDIPTAQDDIIQLGNVNDTTRQGAIVEFVTGTDAPSYQIYQGINSFSLNNKNQIGFGYNTSTGRAYMNVYGDFRFGSKSDSGSYIKYNSQTGQLDVKAKVTFTNTSEMSQFVKDNQNNYDDSELQQAVSDLNDVTDNLQAQIDGAIETIYGDVDPTEEGNDPYEDYTTAEKEKHLGDMYYDTISGYAYRYDKNTVEGVTTYYWTLITDSGITEAIAKAGEALGVANTKAKIFTTNAGVLPSPPYKVNDVWVNATYPANGSSYSNEILKCIKACPENGTADIGHWQKASKYTDDSALTNFVNGDYADTIGALEGQLDKKAETWYQSANPADDWYVVDPETQEVTIDTRADHVGDLWYKTTDNTTWYYKRSGAGTEQDPYTYAWEQQNVPLAVFDKIDGKADIFVSKPSTYNKYDMWIIESSTTTCPNADIPEGCKRGDIVIAKNKRTNSYTRGDWEKKDRYTDDSAFNGYITAFLNGSGASGDSATAAAIQKAIAGALGSGTVVDGGLLLSSLIGMRKYKGSGSVTELSSYDTWGGISGEYNDDDETVEGGAKGHGIAAWYGGDMVDKEMLSAEDIAAGWGATLPDESTNYRWARSLFRFDGSGYVADANITWTKEGALTIKNITTLSDSNNNNILNELATFNSAFTFGTSGQGSTTALYITPNVPFQSLYIGTSNANKKEVATQEWVGNNYVSTAFFRQLFRAFKPNATAGQADVEVEPNTIDATISNIKAMVGLWTEQYVSALGQGSDGGGGGASVLYGLNDVTPNATGDGVMGAQDGYVLTYNGSTHHWYAAATAEAYVLPQATANALGGIKIGYDGTTAKTYAVALDANGKAYVNVPWTDTTYTLPVATSSALGGIKIGYTSSGKNYAVQLSNQQAYVNVPWENTTYDAATQSANGLMSSTDKTKLDGIAENANNYSLPLAASGTRGGIKIGYTESGTNYAVKLSSEKAYVTVPWTNTWRGVYLGGTSKVDTGTSTKALNFVAGSNVTIDYAAAGTEEGQSGSDSYFNIKISSSYVDTWRNILLAGTQKLGTATNTKGLNFVADGKTTITFLAAGTGEGQSGSADYATIKISSSWRGIQNNLTSDSTTDSLSAKQGKALKGSITTLEGYFTNGVANKAEELNTTRTIWGQNFNGTANVSGNMTGVGNITMGSTDGTYIKIGDIYIGYDSTNSAIEIYKLGENNAHVAANLYAHGAISALGEGVDGGGGGTGDVTWDLLASSSDTRQIALSHLTTALSGYSTTSHTHTTTIATDSGTNQLTLAYGTKYKLTAGGTSFVFTMPSADDTNTWRNIYVGGTQQITTAVNTKGLNFAAGSNVSLSFAAAGTGSGQSGNANYGTITIAATDTTYSAGKGLRLLGTQFISDVPRVAKDSKVFGGMNTWIMEEYTQGANYNLPSNHWYHIMSTQGTDTAYGTQLALGMTTEGAYYRRYDNGTWKEWKSLINTNTTYSAGTGISLSGTTFSNSGVRATTINGNYLRVNTNGTNADLTIPYATTANQLNTFSIPFNRLTEQGGNGKQWSRLCTFTDTAITTTQKWYGKYAIFEMYTNGYGDINKVYLGRVSFNITMHGKTSFKGDYQIIRCVNLKKDSISLDHFKVVITDTTVEFFVKNDIWDTVISCQIIRQDGMSIGYNSTYTYTQADFETYCSGKKVVDATLDTLWVGNALNATKATQDSDGNAINTTYLKLSGGTMSNTNLVTNLNADLLDGLHLNRIVGTYTREQIGISPNFDNPSIQNGLFEMRVTSETTGETGTKPFNGFAPFLTLKVQNVMMQLAGGNSNGWFIRGKQSANVTMENTAWQQLARTTDNVASATKLQTSRTINGTSFDGSANITTANWGTARNISIADSDSTNTGSAVSVNGSAAVTLKLPSTIKATLSGNASTATTLQTSRTLWGQSFDGSANVDGTMNISGTSGSYNQGIRIHTFTGASLSSVWFRATNADGYQAGMWGISVDDNGMRFRGNTSKTSTSDPADYMNILHGGNVGIGTTSPSYKLHVNGTFYASGNSSIGGTFGVTGATTLTGLLTANGGIAIASSKTLKIGDIYLAYDSTNNAIEVYKLDGTNHVAANLYARGGISALGQGSDGGGGGQGDVTWALLASQATGDRTIHSSYISGTLANYLPLAGGTMTGALTINPSNVSGYQDGIILNDKGTGASEALTIKWTSATYTTGNKLSADLANNKLIFHNGTSWYNVLTSGDSSVSKSGETLTVKINGTSYSLTNTNTTYSAGAGIRLNNTSIISNAPRVNKDSKAFGGYCTWIMEEHVASSSHNLPSNAYYHIMSTQGDDTTYGTQLALGMTTEGVYYRRYNGGTWGDWKSLINTDTTYSAGNGLSLNGTTFSIASNVLVQGSVIDTHHEGAGTVTLDGTNELYAFYDRGGTCDAYEVEQSATLTNQTLTRTSTAVAKLSANVFNGMVGYNQTDGVYSGEKFAVYDLALPANYPYGANFFWSFGNGSWKPAKMRVLVGAYSASGFTYISKYSTDSCPAYGKVSVSNGATGFNRLRIVVSKYSRLACFGVTFYDSRGLRTTFMNRCFDDAVYRNISPAKDNTWSLGTSSQRWKEVRAVNFYGTFNGTATKATQDSDGNTINSTYLKLSGGTLSGKLNIGSVTTSHATKLEVRTANTTANSVEWGIAVKNPYNDAANYKLGAGIRICLGSDTETNKFGGIAYIGTVTYFNSGKLAFYASGAERAYLTSENLYIGSNAVCHAGNSSVSKSGSTLTVKINGTSQSITDTNTWRGIQDNLTSSSNTTESLSAKQGYLLANGSARDNTKLPLAGGTMTGSIIPNTDNAIDLGSSTKRWRYIYSYGMWGTSGNALRLGGNDTTLMYLTSGGRCGIGTDSPEAKLGVAGGADMWAGYFNGNSQSAVYLCYAGGHGLFINSKSSSDSVYLLSVNYGASDLGSSTNSAMRILANGKVGIGTSLPSQKLHVSGGLLAITYNSRTMTIGAQNDGGIHIYNDNNSSTFFNGGVSSNSDGSYNLGTTSYYWNNTYTKNVYLNSGSIISTKSFYLQLRSAGNEMIVGNNSSNDLHINYRTSDATYTVATYIWHKGTSSSYADHIIGNLEAKGAVTCLTATSSSDIRLKDVQGNVNLNVEQVADAPAIRFLWKKDHSLGMQAGSIAQYWQNVLPETIKEDKEGILSMNYGVAALVAAITTARKVVDHEREIAQLKNRVKALEDENKMLKTKLIA